MFPGNQTDICLTPDGLYSHPTDCSKFYNCGHGVAHLTSCGEGTLWNDDLKVCDWPHNVNCNHSKSWPPYILNTVSPGLSSKS